MSDPYLADVKALFHFDAAHPEFDNAGHTTTVTGSLVTASVSGQFGDAMLACANGAYVSITHADMVIPSADALTLELRVWVPSSLSVGSTTTYWIAGNVDHALGVTLFPGDPNWYGRVRTANGSENFIHPAGCTVRDAPVHLAMSRQYGTGGNNMMAFQDGVPYFALSSFGSAAGVMHFGRLPGEPAFPGYLEEARYTKNVARYTSAFTPDTAPFDDPVPTPPSDPIAVLSLQVTVAAVQTGSSSLALSVAVSAPSTGTSSLPVAVSVIPPAYLSGVQSVCVGIGQAAKWREIVTIDGVDVSSQVVGAETIEASEGAARIAEFTLRPPNGTPLDLAGWTGSAVTIDVADYTSGAPLYAMRLFTGVIDTPTLDKASGTLAIRCTDDLQGRCDAMSNAALSALIGGYESTAIFDKSASGWDFAQDRLSTVTAALDISPTGMMRVTPWAPKLTPDLILNQSLIGDKSIRPQIAGRASLVNEVLIDFGYRFPRVKADGWPISWQYVDPTNFAAFVLAEKYFLQRQQVESAIRAAGGTPESITFIPLPNTVVAVGTGFFTPSSADLDLCQGFTALVSFDYGQTITETHKIYVRNQKSIDQVGLRQTTLSGAMTGAYPDLTAAETGIARFKDKSSAIPPVDVAPVNAEKTTSIDATLTPETDRNAANAAMEALIAIAKAKIWSSHRQNAVTVLVPLIPAIDLDKTVEITAAGVAARGKVRRVVHRMSSGTGEATTEVEIALCAVAGYGVSHASDPTAAPAGTSPGVKNLAGSVNTQYNAGKTEDHKLTLTFPGVEASERENANPTIQTVIAAALIEDLFTVTT